MPATGKDIAGGHPTGVAGRRRQHLGRRSWLMLTLRGAIVLSLVVAGGRTVVRTATVSAWPDRVNPSPDLAKPPHSNRTKAMVRRLERDGIVVQDNVRRMLDALLGLWDRRPDLQAAMVEADGSPNIGALLNWAQSIPDSSATWMAPHLGAVEELRSRLGFLPANGKVLPVIYWQLQNRRHPSHDLTLTIGRLANFWESRPEVRDRCTTESRVDVVCLLKTVNRLPATDPDARVFIDDTIPIHETIAELERNKRG